MSNAMSSFHRLFPKAAFVSAEEKLRLLRMIKDARELKIIEEACALADYAVELVRK